MQKQNVLFVGFMGVGKTTYGKKYAQNNSMNFIDLDEAFELQENTSIIRFFNQYGEEAFRKKEIGLLIHILNKYTSNTVISLGGGTFCSQDNIDLIKKYSVYVIYLNTKIKTLVNRLWMEKKTRPLIAGFNSISDLEAYVENKIKERSFYYLQADQVLSMY